MKLDHDLNIQDFLGATNRSVEEMTNEVSRFRAQLAEVNKRLSYWSNPDKIDSIIHLRRMEDSLRESIERVRIHKENFGKNYCISFECTNQFQNRTPLPVMISGVQEAQPVMWLPSNENQHMLMQNESNFLSHQDVECSTDCSLASYSGFFGSSKQTEISGSGQVDNAVQECNGLNELENDACLNLEASEPHFYQQYSASNFQDDEKLKTDMEVNLQGNPAVNQVISNFEISGPMYNNGHQAWISSSGPCGVALFEWELSDTFIRPMSRFIAEGLTDMHQNPTIPWIEIVSFDIIGETCGTRSPAQEVDCHHPVSFCCRACLLYI